MGTCNNCKYQKNELYCYSCWQCSRFKQKEKTTENKNKTLKDLWQDCQDIYDKLQEKPMENKVIFESEEEFSRYDNQVNDSTYKGRLRNAKDAGFIRKSPVEEAEEMYMKFINTGDCDGVSVMCRMLYDAIQYLKERRK